MLKLREKIINYSHKNFHKENFRKVFKLKSKLLKLSNKNKKCFEVFQMSNIKF